MARPRAKSTTPQFSFRLDPQLRRDLEILAKADDRSLGFYIERVMRKHRDDRKDLLDHLRKQHATYPEPRTAIAAAAEESDPAAHAEAESQRLAGKILDSKMPSTPRRGSHSKRRAKGAVSSAR